MNSQEEESLSNVKVWQTISAQYIHFKKINTILLLQSEPIDSFCKDFTVLFHQKMLA